MRDFILIIVGMVCITYLGLDSYNKTKGNTEKEKINGGVKITFPSSSKASYDEWTVIRGSDGHDYLESNGDHDYVLIHYTECEKCKIK